MVGDTPRRPPFQLRLQRRGREAGKEEIERDYENSNVGHIGFLDAARTCFDGEANFQFVGGGVRFSRYKVGDDSRRHGPLRWDEYSELAYEAARVERWH